MSAGAVLDASVTLKLVLDEELREHAQALFQDCIKQRTPACGPPLLFAEVTNAIHQRVRRNTLSVEEAQDALDTFFELDIEPVSPEDVHQRAYAFARAHQIKSIYDALYVVTAQLLDVELWTADQNLINALGDSAPWVRWIGDYPLPDAR